MSITTVTPADRWAWQQRAYRALGLILQHGNPNTDHSLPPIEWSILDGRPTVCGTIRQVHSIDEEWDPVEVFEAWRTTLDLTKHWNHHNSYLGQTEYRAVAERWRPDLVGGSVTVALFAAVYDPLD